MGQHVHGNPTIAIGSEGRHPGQQLIVENPQDERVWCSYPLHPSQDTVRVDVWRGRFAGAERPCSILPAAAYVANLKSSSGDVREVDRFRVVEESLFEADFRRPRKQWFDPERQWHDDGRWADNEAGVVAEGGMAYVFADGAMHGLLEGVFTIPSNVQSGRTWGLIAQHYNGLNFVRIIINYQQPISSVRLMRFENGQEKHIAQQSYPVQPGATQTIRWDLNGRRHRAWINGDFVLEAEPGHLGGVTVVGLFAEADSVICQQFRMRTAQAVPSFDMVRDEYHALIRPGNIQSFKLLKSADPHTSIFWESGLQFGHIGGSEIKYTQASALDLICQGEAVNVVRWSGPMPKFVEQSSDVRGLSHGQACFYEDRIVMADFVLTWVRRSVGPDFDMLGRVLNGHARIALRDDRTFREWELDETGKFNSLDLTTCGATYPVAVIFPLRLGGEQWFLKAVIGSLLHVDGSAPASMFAWRCPRRLTASHDFRAAPTRPGIDYGFSIVTTWQKSADVSQVEKDLLNLRDDWFTPMRVTPQVGSAVTYGEDVEYPAEAIGFDGPFDRATGTYVLVAENDRVSVQLDPRGIHRRSAAIRVRNFAGGGEVHGTMDGQKLRAGTDFLVQEFYDESVLLLLRRPIHQPAVLDLEME